MDINKPSNDEAIASDSSDSSSSLSSSSSDDSSSSSVSSENLLADVANERHSAASCASIHKTISQGAPGAVDGDLSANSDSENGDSTYATQVEQPPKKTRKTPVRNVERFPEKLNRLLREVEVIGRTDVISFIDDNTFKIHKKVSTANNGLRDKCF